MAKKFSFTSTTFAYIKFNSCLNKNLHFTYIFHYPFEALIVLEFVTQVSKFWSINSCHVIAYKFRIKNKTNKTNNETDMKDTKLFCSYYNL